MERILNSIHSSGHIHIVHLEGKCIFFTFKINGFYIFMFFLTHWTALLQSLNPCVDQFTDYGNDLCLSKNTLLLDLSEAVLNTEWKSVYLRSICFFI